MQVDVHDRLACGCSAVDADVVAVGPVCCIQQGFCTGYQGKDCGLFGGCEVKPGCGVPPGNHQQVTGGDRVEIVPGVGKVIFQDSGIRAAEGTVSHKKSYSRVFLPRIRSRSAISSS